MASSIQIIETVLQVKIIMMVGLYFIFSNTIMTALKNHKEGADVMVLINKVILNPVFMLFFMGSGIGATYFLVFGNMMQAIGGGVFLVGTTIVTILRNVPLNNQLRDANHEDSHNPVWSLYLDKWVFWNHVRSISAIVASFFFLI